MTPEGIAAYVAANPRSGGEVNLLSNDLKTPYSDQFSLGMRNLVQLWGQDWNTSVTLSHIRSKDGIYFRLGNRWPGGNFHENPDATWGGQPWAPAIPGDGSLLIGDHSHEYTLKSVLVLIAKTKSSDYRWGVTLP